MGSPHHIYSPKELSGLSAANRKRLQKEISQLVKNDPMVREIIKAHRNMRKHLKEKLGKK
jgi:hypothetical protein